MSVLIKGMKMPDHCWECWLMRNLICGASGELIPSSGKRKHCPLVDLDKHGRLIDADKLMDDIKNNSASYFADDFAREWVDVQPTVIEAEDG